jgi:O-antigen ligase
MELPMTDLKLEHTGTDLRMTVLAWLACLTLFALSIGTAPTSLCSGVLLLVWLLSGTWRKGVEWWWRKRQWLVPLVLVMLLPWVSLLWTVAPELRFYPYLQRTHFWLLSLAVTCIAFLRVQPRHLAMALIAGVELNALLFLVAKSGLMLPYPKLYRFTQTGYITYSLLLVLGTLLMSYWYREARNAYQQIFVALVMLLNAAVVAMLKGRSGYLALLLLLPVIVSNVFGWRRWRIVLVVVAGLAFGLLQSPYLQERLLLVGKETSMYTSGTEKARDTSTGTRLALWSGAMQIFREHPLVGVGIDGYPVVMKRLYPDWNAAMSNPHNYYLYVASSYGLMGIALYGWLGVALFKRCWGARNSWSGFMLLSTLLVVCIGSFTETTPLQPQTGILLAMMVGLPMSETTAEGDGK